MRIEPMTYRPARPALVCNNQSGSYDEERAEQIAALCSDAGSPIVAHFCLPDDALPTRSRLEADGIDTAIVWTGDGTINAAVAALAGWGGTLLVLPGGTLNLLSKRLHGDRPLEEILADALAGRCRREYPPTVECPAGRAMVNMIAGPTTIWAEVREQVRQRDIAGAAALVPEAFEQSMGGEAVHLEGDDRTFQAISMTPSADGIMIDGLLADTPTLLLRHAIAWIGGDFRDGPSEELATRPSATIVSAEPLGLLMDGESTEGSARVTVSIAPAPVAFIVTRATA